MKVARTVYPKTIPSFNEWAEEFRVSCQVSKFDGQLRAEKMMQTWESLSSPRSTGISSLIHMFKEIFK